jgi:hypothetical protein
MQIAQRCQCSVLAVKQYDRSGWPKGATLAEQVRAKTRSIFQIEAEQESCRAARGSKRLGILPTEMICPPLLTWMAQGRHGAGHWVTRSEIRPFETIAFKAGIGEIF